MNIIKIAVFAVIAAAIVVLIRKIRPEMALPISLASGALMLLAIVGELSGLMESIDAIAARFHMDTAFVGIIFKAIGIAYIAQLADNICKDAGETALASKVELGGRIMILLTVTPLVLSMLETITGMLPAGAA
ncbi:MAG: stage III sporulation protein AD [Eubacteriales bacterium]|nr:stage III sporulation protein AD [Eubacteriales bacterium]